MPGIAGLVAINTPNQVQKILAQLIKGLHPNDTEIVRIQSSAFGAGIAGRKERGAPAVAQKDHLVLCVLGQVVIEPEFREYLFLTGAGKEYAPLADTLLALYEQYGISALQGLNGQYVIVLWDGRSQSLSIVNDRYGLLPFYYWCSHDGLAFASSMRAIARHPAFQRNLNPAALFDLLAAGHMLGERTMFEEVCALAPATRLVFRKGRVEQVRYWQPGLYQQGDPVFSEEEYAERMTRLLRQAVERHTQPGSILLLTGGIDSRLLAGILSERYDGASLQSHTIGHARALDARVAEQVARHLDMPHTTVPVNPCYLNEYAVECVLRTEGGMNLSEGWILGESEPIEQSRMRRVITGVGAELVSGRHWLAELDEEDPDHAIAQMCKDHWHFQPAARLLKKKYRECASQSSMDLLLQTLASAPSEAPNSRYDYLHMVQHRRHPTGNILSHDAEVDEPFYDHDLVDYALCIPPHMRKSVYLKVMGHVYAGLPGFEQGQPASITNAEAITRISRGHQIRRFANRVLRRLPVKTSMNLASVDDPWRTIYPNQWLRTNSRAYVTGLFNKLNRLEEWIEVPQARELLQDHLDGRRNHYRMISALMTALLWMELVWG